MYIVPDPTLARFLTGKVGRRGPPESPVGKRIAPGVLEELKRVTPRDDNGRPKHKYFQRLTQNVRYPKLREHLGAVVAIIRLSDGWNDFMDKLNRHYPRLGETMLLPFPEDNVIDKDDGTGG